MLLKWLRSSGLYFILLSGTAAAEVAPSDPVPEPKLSRAEKTAFLSENEDAIRTACFRKQEVIEVSDKNVLCISGSIRSEHKPKSHRSYSFAYVYSSGGEMFTSFEIGREISKNKAYLLVDKHCHSSCANYIIPAANRIYMTDNTVISMHGAPTRRKTSYMIQQLQSGGVLKKDALSDKQRLKEIAAGYKNYAEKFVIPEVRYFIDIEFDEAYVTRFHEVRRSLNKKPNNECKPGPRLNIIIGPEYFRQFGIKTVREWFAETPEAYLELKPKSKKTHPFIYDFDEYPFWIPKKGLLGRADCMANDENGQTPSG
ncbi:MAG: hypothetical protein AAGB16_01675 [Pseudomonadota bacterium]